MDREKVIKGLVEIIDYFFDIYRNDTDSYKCEKAQEYYDVAIDAIALLNEQEAAYQGAEELLRQKMILFDDAIKRLKEQEKEIKSLRLLVEWAEECDFGFDQFPDEYERYKDEIKDMKYVDGMIHVAKRTLEDHGAFEEGW